MKSQNTTPVSVPPPTTGALFAIAHEQKEDRCTLAFIIENWEQAPK